MIINDLKLPNYSVLLTVKAEQPVELAIRGVEKSLPGIVYFERWYGNRKYNKPFQGTKTFMIPVPIKPYELKIDVYDRNLGYKYGREGLTIVSTKIIPLSKPSIDYKPRVTEFIDFAKQISVQSTYLPLGSYRSNNGNYVIHLVDQVRDPEGNIMDTIASVWHDNGEIQIRKGEFDSLTVPNKLMILFHEFAHFWSGLFEEDSSDQVAVDLFKAEGFASTEAIMTLYKLFHSDLVNREEKEYRVENLFYYILNNYEHPQAA